MLSPPKLSVIVENHTTGSETLKFGGEWFSTGGWAGDRALTIEDHAVLEFDSKGLVLGVSGYVYYHNADHTRHLVLSFSITVTAAPRFTARASSALIDCQAVWGRSPGVSQPGTGLRKADGCAWETMEIEDGKVCLRCVVLPADGGIVPEELKRRVAKARCCPSTISEITAPSDGVAMLVERRVLLEIENRSDETFLFDGDWFECGRWLKPTETINARSRAEIDFVGEDLVRGVAGLCWFVNEGGLDKYFSFVVSNPFAIDGVFSAWAGPPPAELYKEMACAPVLRRQSGVQVHQGRGCAWNIIEFGSVLTIRIAILPDPVPMDPFAYPPELEGKAPGVTTMELACPSHVRREVSEEAKSDWTQFLAHTRPRDAIDGLGSGIKVAGAGALVGTVALVGLPVVGAHQDGARGLFWGLLTGGLGATVLALGGGVACAAQVVRGVYNTPEAIQQTYAGKRWDKDYGVWVDAATNLRQEILQVDHRVGERADADLAEDDATRRMEGRRDVVDTTFYDVIGVSPSATPVEVKQAYFKAALRVHPDKNPGDREAHQRFQELAEAYQVLSDPKLRERYDSMGQEAVGSEVPSIDPCLFFSMLFGSEQFEKYIGKLYLAMQTDHFAKDLQRHGESRDREGVDLVCRELFLKREQFEREVQCAAHLCSRLDRWVTRRDERGFVSASCQEATELVRVSFGGRLLRVIGHVYESSAERWLSALRRDVGVLSSVREGAHGVQVRANVASSIARSALAVKRAASAAVPAGGDEEAAREEATREALQSLEESLPVFLQTVWDLSVVDIESTLRRVCDKVLLDISVPWQLRQRRAFALRRLGRIFRDVGQVEHSDVSKSQVAKQHVEEALHRAMHESAHP